jgi:hypothetical protein
MTPVFPRRTNVLWGRCRFALLFGDIASFVFFGRSDDSRPELGDHPVDRFCLAEVDHADVVRLATGQHERCVPRRVDPSDSRILSNLAIRPTGT